MHITTVVDLHLIETFFGITKRFGVDHASTLQNKHAIETRIERMNFILYNLSIYEQNKSCENLLEYCE